MKITDKEKIDDLISSMNFKTNWNRLYQVLNKIDFSNISGDLDQKSINKIIVMCLCSFADYIDMMDNNTTGNFELMSYSMFRHIVSKIDTIINPIIQIEIPAKIFSRNVPCKITYKDITRCYIMINGGCGFKCIKGNEYENCKISDDNNDSDVIECIPLTEMEF